MKLFKLGLFVTSLVLSASIAQAGDIKMVRAADGMQLEITCTGSGCKVRGKNANSKWGTVERTRGGSKNFDALVEKYTEMGFVES